MVEFLHKKDIQVGEKDVPNFPGTLCVSINDEIIHGIPSSRRVIKDGDVVSIDLVVYKNGFHGDAARTFKIGRASCRERV